MQSNTCHNQGFHLLCSLYQGVKSKDSGTPQGLNHHCFMLYSKQLISQLCVHFEQGLDVFDVVLSLFLLYKNSLEQKKQKTNKHDHASNTYTKKPKMAELIVE